MNSQDKQLPPIKPPHGGGQLDIDMNQYKQGYYKLVSMMLARARRDCDHTDKITAEIAACRIGPTVEPQKQPETTAQQTNPSPS